MQPSQFRSHKLWLTPFCTCFCAAETYRSILPLYYRGAAIVVLVYDITNKVGWLHTTKSHRVHVNGICTATFTQESLRQAKWWVKQVKQECDPGVVIALVGNKLDLAESHRDVPTEVSCCCCCTVGEWGDSWRVEFDVYYHALLQEAAKYADNNGFLHIETSAKTNTNINELFKLVGKLNTGCWFCLEW